MKQISREEVISCRRELHNCLGSALGEKATDEFCVAFAQASWTRPAPARFIIELTPQSPPEADQRAAELNPERREPDRERAPKNLATKPGSLHEGYATDLRERSYRAATPIIAELRGGLPWELAAGAGSGSAKDSPRVEFCWLNQIIRTSVDPRRLAELASEIHRVDLPRLLFKEVGRSCALMGAIAYRERSNRSGTGVKVAVIDSEVDVEHPALGKRVEQKGNFTDEGWGKPDAHGTAIAGIIAADAKDFAGVAPGATIFHYKVFSRLGTGSDDFDGACALAKAVDDKARVANCSWGTAAPTNGTSREARMCDHAWKSGLTVVKSAGHGGKQALAITSPGDAEGVIVVGATERGRRRVMGYSSRGPTENDRARPHLVAPGGSRRGPIFTCDLSRSFGRIDPGTSLAAAHVSGVLALILEGSPELTPNQQRDELLKLCDAFPENDPNTHGAGFLSLDRLPPL
jgi:serine protease AprX